MTQCPKDGKRCYVQYTRTGFRFKCRHQQFTMYSYACNPMIDYWNKKMTVSQEPKTHFNPGGSVIVDDNFFELKPKDNSKEKQP